MKTIALVIIFNMLGIFLFRITNFESTVIAMLALILAYISDRLYFP